MGRQVIESILYEDAIVSVTGGSTMANVSRAMHLLPFNVFFVPLVVVLVRMLFIKLTRFQRAWRNKQVVIIQHFMYQIMCESTYNTLLMEPSVVHTLDKIKQANITIHGIGDA